MLFDKQPPTSDRDNTESEIEPPKNEPKLREKLFGNDLKAELDSAIGGAIKKLEKTLDVKVDEKIREVEQRALELFRKWRVRFALTMFAFLCVAVWFADAIKKGLAALWELVKTLITLEDDETVGGVEKGEKTDDVQSDEKSA